MIVGIDVGGTKMLGVGLDGGTVVAERRVPTPTSSTDAVADLVELVDHLCADESPSAIGVGIPGMVDRSGVLRFSAHLPGLVDVDVALALAETFPNAAVWLGNDATAAGWAEHQLGAGRGADDVLTVTLGTGIGGGIVSGGRLVEGTHGYAGEWGHMVVDPHGPPCPCGKRGCWERFASGGGLGRLGRDEAIAGRAPRIVALAGGDPEAVRGEHVTAAAAEGDEEGRSILAGLAWWLALGLANLANAFDPEVIVLGGGLVEAGEALIGPTREAFPLSVEGGERRSVRIVAAELGVRAGAIGAALLAGNVAGGESALR